MRLPTLTFLSSLFSSVRKGLTTAFVPEFSSQEKIMEHPKIMERPEAYMARRSREFHEMGKSIKHRIVFYGRNPDELKNITHILKDKFADAVEFSEPKPLPERFSGLSSSKRSKYPDHVYLAKCFFIAGTGPRDALSKSMEMRAYLGGEGVKMAINDTPNPVAEKFGVVSLSFIIQ